MVCPCCLAWYIPQRTISYHSGGKRDPDDADDRVTAERETQEEIGLSLTPENSIYCGGLDQRLVSTSGSTVPLMVLCPYGITPHYHSDTVYILISPIIPELHLQPSEVDSWRYSVDNRLIVSILCRWICYCHQVLEHMNTSTRVDV